VDKDSGEMRRQGWRQGDLITGQAAARIISSCCDGTDFLQANSAVLLVLSQDCDLVAEESREPYIEFLAGTCITTVDSMKLNGRNPRFIQVQTAEQNITFCIHDRFRMKKNDFCKVCTPRSGKTLNDSDRRMVLKWVAKRYTRPAFPDEFNKRLSKKRKIQEVLYKSELARKIIVVLVDVSEKELESNENYIIKILVGVVEETTEDERFLIERQFEEAFTVCGIILQDIAVHGELDITVRELRTYKLWDKEYRSYPESEESPLPPVGIDVE